MTTVARDKTRRREATPVAVKCFMAALATAARDRRAAEGYLLELLALLAEVKA